MSDLDRLYTLLDAAHVKAEAGDEQAKKDAQEIYSHIQQAKREEARTTETPPVIGGIVGAYAGTPISTGYGAYKTYQGLKDTGAAEAIKQFAMSKLNKNPQVSPSGVRSPNANMNWTEAMTGISPPGSQMNKESMDTANRMVKTIGPGGELAGGQIHGGSIMTGPDMKKQVADQLAARAQALKDTTLGSRFAKGVGNVAENFGKVYSPLAKIAGPILGGFQAGSEGVDAYNRFNRDDTVGGLMSLAGAATGAASMYPPAAPVAIPLSLGITGLNWLREHNPKAFEQYMQEMSTAGAQ
jgi:hypothetical protein